MYKIEFHCYRTNVLNSDTKLLSTCFFFIENDKTLELLPLFSDATETKDNFFGCKFYSLDVFQKSQYVILCLPLIYCHCIALVQHNTCSIDFISQICSQSYQ